VDVCKGVFFWDGCCRNVRRHDSDRAPDNHPLLLSQPWGRDSGEV